jgi:hypothetical protein
MDRDIFIYPVRSYSFRTNSSYRDKWLFLPNLERRAVIAEQLTYLEFHECLFEHLWHTLEPKPSASDLSRLGLHVAEGFFRTDILLYASLCEAALYVVAKDVFDS